MREWFGHLVERFLRHLDQAQILRKKAPAAYEP